eukprot:scaffold219_cov156-Amphora_coffeaeformis.AAC.3
MKASRSNRASPAESILGCRRIVWKAHKSALPRSLTRRNSPNSRERTHHVLEIADNLGMWSIFLGKARAGKLWDKTWLGDSARDRC